MYKEVVRQIRELRWQHLSVLELQSLMVLSCGAAEEFAESLRIALQHYPRSEMLKGMARGELNTDNLRFKDYDKRADHCEFLKHFIIKHKLRESCPKEILDSREKYLETVRALPRVVRAMSIPMREQELPDVFRGILRAPDWSGEALEAYQYFLRRHIELDEGASGHAAQLSTFTVDDRVLPFCEARLELYKPIRSLWSA